MKLRAFTYLLLLLMTFQSAAGLADIHTAHQSGLEHLTFEDHQHTETEDDHFVDFHNQFESDERDCHHCCHCHGHSTPAIIIAVDRIFMAKSSSLIPDYPDKTIPDTFETFLRPPIA